MAKLPERLRPGLPGGKASDWRPRWPYSNWVKLLLLYILCVLRTVGILSNEEEQCLKPAKIHRSHNVRSICG